MSRRRFLAAAGGAAVAGLLGVRGRSLGGAPERTNVLMVPGLVVGSSAGVSPSGQGATATGRSAELLPAGAVRFGAWNPGVPRDIELLAALEGQIGQPLGIVMWYQGWGAANAPLDTDILSAVSARGSVPMVTWEPWDYTRGTDQTDFRADRIASGAFDAYVRSWAAGLAAWGGPLILRFAHEMNNPKYPWSAGANGNTPAEVVAAWRRVRAIFDEAGASNVAWHWCPNVDWAGSGKVPFADLYPGDDVVDFVGVDGYNGGTAVDWGGWQSFSAVFDYSVGQLRSLTDRPMVLGEVGCAEQGGDKAGWVRDMLVEALPGAFGDVRAVVWFNEQREADWRIESSPASLEAFRSGLRLPRYAGAPG